MSADANPSLGGESRLGLPPRLLFVTGAPRSGTALVSDWVSQSPWAYCAHEISREVVGMTDAEIVQYLWGCAETGSDRMGKVGVREHMRWEGFGRKDPGCLRLLGFKEPVFWPVQSTSAPYHVAGFLRKFGTHYVVILRHPYDVVASGKHRAAATHTWPEFTTEQHARLWPAAAKLPDLYAGRGSPTLFIKWEDLLLDADAARLDLARFLGVPLPASFHGYEHTPERIQVLRSHVSPAGGLVSGGHRHYLAGSDIKLIDAIVGPAAAELGYLLPGA